MMKRLFYQIFIVKHGRVELFFILSILTSFAFYPSRFAGALFAFALPFGFIRRKRGVLIGLIVLCLYLFASNALLITGEKSSDKDKRLYTTTSGTLVTAQALSAGDIVIGGYEKQKYSGEAEGRYARGYFVSDVELYSIHLPFIGGILENRQELSDKLFAVTGGALRLTQGIVLGDKQYLEDDVIDKFQLTGLGHLLAISGLHVGLYTMVVYLIFGFLPYKLRLIPAGLVLLLLIPFTGFKIPVLRAGLIGFAIITAKFFDYTSDVRKLLLFFAGLFILISPSMLASPSFLLSFSAVYGLLHLDQLKYPKFMAPVAVGLVATLFIIPAGTATFGTFNISSVVTTIFLIPVLSAQVICFLIYLIFPSMSLAPMILLEKIHLWMIDIFAGAFAPFFTLYKAHIGWALAMAFFLFLCTRLRLMWLALVLLAVPYIPSDVEMGGYFPNLGRSKGFVVVDDRVHVFYKGHHGDFVYGFLPYLAEIGVKRADTGTIDIYGGENIFIPVGEVSEDYGWVCVNSLDESCKAVYHTRSNTYGCDEDRVHILYKNRCADENTYLLYETGDLKIDNPSK